MDTESSPEGRQYTYLGEVHECNCQVQSDLRNRYLLANIPIRYWRYSHNDWYGPTKAWDEAENYVDHWPGYKELGIGIEFFSPGQGSGKTFLATWIARQLVQQAERVYYVRMLTLMNLRDIAQGDAVEAKVRSASALVIDEVGYGITEAQTGYFAHTLEDIVRDRVDNARPTIMTTNLEPSQLDHYYPRIYSVLAGAQMRHEVSFEDVRRKGDTLMLDRELVRRGETRPIC